MESISDCVSIIHRQMKLLFFGNCYIHSFILDIYIAPLQETYSEAFSVQLWPKRIVLRSLQKEDTLFWGSKRNVRVISSASDEGMHKDHSFVMGKGAHDYT